MDFSPPGSSVCGISQAIILEWVAVSFSMGSSWLRDWLYVSCIGRRILYHWASWEALTVCISSVQFSSVAQSCPNSLRPHESQHARPPCPSPTPRVHWVSDAIQPSHPLSSLLLPSIFPSIRVFSNESTLCLRWPKYWSYSFSISPFNAYSGLISLRIDLFDLAVQRALKSFLQHYSSKASIPWSSAFFMVQLSYPHMTTGKTIALTNMDLCKQNDVSAF